jgi:ligand-binding sensor domain-containing protein/DNA-binding CsgD family transcriptional regulator
MLLKMYRKLILILSLCFGISVWSQFSNAPGIPIVVNFTEEAVNNDLTTYDISQNQNGIMYFATPSGLLEFDGVRWKNYAQGLESDLRAVLYKDAKHIYTAGHGGFGYWGINNIGVLEYTRLFLKLPEKKAPLLPIFSRIIEINGKIIFQSFQQIFIYNPVTDELITIGAKKGFNFLFSSKGSAFIQETGIGLFELKGDELQLVEGTENTTLHILNVFEQKQNKLLIVTKNNGFWSLEDGVFTKNKWEINTAIEKHLVNDIRQFQEDKFVIGTLRKGVYVVSDKGKILIHQEKSNGLLDNTIRKIFIDLNENVWLGMENGLSYLQISSNTSYLLDYKGAFGTVYTSYLEDASLYLGTNQGLFVKDSQVPNSKINLIDNSIGQIWEIEKIDDQILVGSHEGVSVLENKKLKLLYKEGGAWVFKKHPKLKEILYVGFYSGIAVFKRRNGNWVFEKKWNNYGESSRFIAFDKYGDLWVTHPSKGYYRLSLSEDGLDLENYEFYGTSNDQVATYAYICKIDDDLVFYNPKGYFSYDPIDNSFVSQKYSTQLFKNINSINSIVQSGNIFWYSTPKEIGYILRTRNRFNNVRNPFYSIRNKHLNDFNKFEKVNDSIFGIGINNGIVFHNINKSDIALEKEVPIIRSIEFISKTDTIVSQLSSVELVHIPSDNNFLKVAIALPKTPLANSYKIQYKLKGLNKVWSDWQFVSELTFPGLTPGDYSLELRSGGEGETISNTMRHEFHINSPWYLTKLVFIFYALLLLCAHGLYRLYFKNKNLKQIRTFKQIESDKRKSQEEKFKLDKLESERELLLLREENLSLEIKKKDSALASATLNNIKKNELLTDLVIDISNIDNELLNSSLHLPVKKVIKKIKNNLLDKEDWLTFQLHFNNLHAQFFDKLREKHPDLSSNEIKLSAYLKLNLSSKEIAALMHVAITSVEQGRYRLRKKINLDKEVNLVNYIQDI